MEITQLRQFVAVAEEGSITAAAERLDIAQPALSQSLSRLERRLGLRLFERSRRGARLTEAGRLLMDDARATIAHASAVRGLASRIASGLEGEIAIGFTSGALYRALPRALQTIRAEMPRMRIRLCEMNTNEQLAAVASGDIDLGFVHSPIPAGTGVNHRKLADYGLLAVVPESLPPGRAEITLEELAEQGLILFPKDHGVPTRAQVKRVFDQVGLELRVVQEANRALTAMSCVAAGLGAALIPEWIRAQPFAGVRYCSIRGPNAFPRIGLSLIWQGAKAKAVVTRLKLPL